MLRRSSSSGSPGRLESWHTGTDIVEVAGIDSTELQPVGQCFSCLQLMYYYYSRSERKGLVKDRILTMIVIIITKIGINRTGKHHLH